MQSRGIIIEAVLLKDVQLPQELSKSIELKAKAEQDAARMEFILAKERQEAERKSIEATGIAKFQQIVTEGISPNLLKWKGIEATEKIAESTNSKIIIIGNNVEGLPVLFSGDDAR
jgi:regulator of protease activity HflC (stomatin/prohibitin superfamily)